MAPPNIPAAKRAGLGVDLGRLTREGDGWLTPEDRYALKTHGVCTQVQEGVFMIRVRIPGGVLTPGQACGVADLAERHGRQWVHLTTRQNIELHHVKARDVAAVLAGTEALGLTNRSACGHTMRNVMSCPDAGVGLDEPFDCTVDARLVSDALLARSAEINVQLPSRINIAFGGCPSCASHARLNDAGFESRMVDGVAGYRLWAGGSLGVMPFLGVVLIEHLPREQAVAAAEALTQVFIDLGDLEHPKKGRLKFLLESLGADDFQAAFEERFAVARPRAPTPPIGVLADADIAAVMGQAPVGGWSGSVRPQRTPGLAMATVNVPLGDLVSDELRSLADLASIGDGLLRLTRNQNVLLRDVPVSRIPLVEAGVRAAGLQLFGADGATDVRACTGSAVCSLAITASPETGARLLDRPSLRRNAALRVNVSGCPNSCAQHQAADIGLAGAKVRIAGLTRLGYTVFLGADLERGRMGEVVGRVAVEAVEEVVDGLLGAWEALRHPGEGVGRTLERVGLDAFASHVGRLSELFEAGPEPEDPAFPAGAGITHALPVALTA